MADKLLPPGGAGELPQIDIVFQTGNLLGGKAGDPGFKHFQQHLCAKPGLHRREGAQNKAGDRLPVHLGGLGHKAGDVPALQGRVQAAVIPLGAAADDGDLPIAEILLCHQTADGGRHKLRLLIGIPGLEHLNALMVLAGHGLSPAEELSLHQLQVLVLKPGRSRKRHRGLNPHAVFLGGGGKPAPGPVHQGEQAGAGGVQAVGTQRHHHLVRPAENLGQHRKLLSGKALKGVHRHGVSLEKTAGLQSLGQPGQVVPGVQIGGGHQPVVCIVQQGKLPQLFAQAPVPQGPGGFQQVSRGDAAHLHLVDGGEHHVVDPPALGSGGVHLQPVLAGLNGRGHENPPAPVAEPAAHRAALPAKHGLRQTGKAVHRNGVAPHRPRQPEHGLFRFKGVLLRHKHHNAAKPGPAPVGQQAAQVFRLSAAGPSQDKLQHAKSPFLHSDCPAGAFSARPAKRPVRSRTIIPRSSGAEKPHHPRSHSRRLSHSSTALNLT